MAGLRNGLRRAAEMHEHWAGIPMPLDGERLVIEPTYPKAKELAEIGAPKPDPEGNDGWTIRNTFWSWHRRCNIVTMEKDGRVSYGMVPGVHHFGMDLHTLGCSDAWGIEQESNALDTLAHLIKHRAFKQYLLTGMFLETSGRTKITYCFRRLRPTVAMRPGDDGKMKILCTLCMHPIAYYSETWAGAMCPTDDVIAHLSLMRGDEPMYWRRSNQHQAYRPESGL